MTGQHDHAGRLRSILRGAASSRLRDVTAPRSAKVSASAQWAVLASLVGLAEDDGTIPTQPTAASLAAVVRLHEDTIRRALHALAEAELVTIAESAGRPSRIAIVLEAIERPDGHRAPPPGPSEGSDHPRGRTIRGVPPAPSLPRGVTPAMQDEARRLAEALGPDTDCEIARGILAGGALLSPRALDVLRAWQRRTPRPRGHNRVRQPEDGQRLWTMAEDTPV